MSKGAGHARTPSISDTEITSDIYGAAPAEKKHDDKATTPAPNTGNSNPETITNTTTADPDKSTKIRKKDLKLNVNVQPSQKEKSLTHAAAASVTTPTILLRELSGSASPLAAKAVETVENNRYVLSTLIILYFAGMSAACFYFGIMYENEDSLCSTDDAYIMDISIPWFLYAAGNTSFIQLIASAYAWYNGCIPAEKESEFKIAADGGNSQTCCDHIIHLLCCIAFWNIVWAILGFAIWGSQMNEDCRIEEAAPIMVLIFGVCLIFGACAVSIVLLNQDGGAEQALVDAMNDQ